MRPVVDTLIGTQPAHEQMAEAQWIEAVESDQLLDVVRGRPSRRSSPCYGLLQSA